jgi:hypothetical protein
MPARAEEILRYFTRHPQAADTLEGVARWRLLEDRVQRSVEGINDALDWLVAQGFLLQELTAGSGAIFRLNQQRISEAEELLKVVSKTKEDGD